MKTKYLLGYIGVGLVFDYMVYRRNAPTGVVYSPTLRFIAGWPYYMFKAK